LRELTAVANKPASAGTLRHGFFAGKCMVANKEREYAQNEQKRDPISDVSPPRNCSATETLRDGAHDHDPRPASGGPRWLASRAHTDKRGNAPLSLLCGQTGGSEKEAHYFLDIDFVKHVALVVVAHEDGRPIRLGAPATTSSTGQGRDRLRAHRQISGQRDWLRVERHLPAIEPEEACANWWRRSSRTTFRC
jgi:hypothetical protein